MVCYSYKDTRLSVFRPAASRNLNPCWSWPQADHGSSQHLHTALRPPWYLRPGEGRAGYQSKETSQARSQLILILLGTNQQVLAQSPSLLPSINTLVSTALLSASHYLASFKHAAAKIVSGNFLVKTKEAFSTQTAAICRISSGPANVKHMGSITIPEKCHFLPLQSIHQPRRHILQNNPEVPIWSKHIPGQKTALPPCNVPYTIHDMSLHAEAMRTGTPCLQLPH